MPDSKSNKPAVTSKRYEIFLKDLLLKRSETFCMIPWVHLHTTPTGQGAPCCISKSCADNEGIGNSRDHSLADLVNSPKMKKLRLDMIKEPRIQNVVTVINMMLKAFQVLEHRAMNVGANILMMFFLQLI